MTDETRDCVKMLDAKTLRALLQLEKAGRWPKRIVLKNGRYLWSVSELEKWLAERDQRSS